MATEKQIRANRENAKRSTGPRTPEGKSTSRFNAVKHGVLARHVVLPNEDAAEFEALRDGFRETLQPLGTLEELLFEIVVTEAWRLQRCLRVETAIISDAIYSRVAEDARSEIADSVDESPRWQNALTAARDEQAAAAAKAPDAHLRLCEAEAILGSADVKIARALAADTDEAVLTKLPRYEAHLWRSFSKVLAELQAVQARREPRSFG